MTRAPWHARSVLLLASLLPACQIIGGFDDFHESTPGDSGANGSQNAACPSGEDPGKHGSKMTQIARPDGACFWVDTTEVTIADYRAFLAVPPPAQDSVCAWNAATDGAAPAGSSPGFAPAPSCAAQVPNDALALGLEGKADGSQPMTCVDWCDALAFCAWAGKDLCRDDGDEQDQTAASDWLAACRAGQSLYGCANDCSAPTCNGSSAENNEPQPVGSLPGCAVSSSDATKVFDLSGNAAEWSNWCSPNTASGSCLVRGGSYASNDSALECGSAARVTRSASLPTLGFRCCSGQ